MCGLIPTAGSNPALSAKIQPQVIDLLGGFFFSSLFGMPSGMPWHAGLDWMFLDKSGSVTAQQTDYLNASNTSLDLQVCHLSARAHARCRSISYSHTFVLEAVTAQYRGQPSALLAHSQPLQRLIESPAWVLPSDAMPSPRWRQCKKPMHRSKH